MAIEIIEDPQPGRPRRTGIFAWAVIGMAILDVRRWFPSKIGWVDEGYRPLLVPSDDDLAAKRRAEDYVAGHSRSVL